MFEKNRVITAGVKEKVPDHIQNILWFLIETMPVKDLDYLQVFELKGDTIDGIPNQVIIHKQEQPPYSMEYTYRSYSAYCGKIFVIDDGEHSTMLLAEEY